MTREIVYKALIRCRRDGAWSSQTFFSLVNSSGLSARDRSFAMRLFYGILQNLYLLDFYIDYFSDNKPQAKVRDALRIGVYQILFMDGVPDRAAVNETVSMTKSVGLNFASGFVNAFLRKIVHQKNELPEIKGEEAEIFSIRYSHPRWLVNCLIKERGVDGAEAVLQANNKATPVFIQINTLKPSAEKMREYPDAVPFPGVANGLMLKNATGVFNSVEFSNGFFYAQDPAARMAVSAAELKPGMQVLDACAAPGGKSFAAAIDMKNKGYILSRDINEAKVKLICEGARRLGIDIIACESADATEPLEGEFDVVIADVPCSGLGVIRKKPEIRYKDEKTFSGLADIQKKIITNLAHNVKPGGILLYSTCTFRHEENGDITSEFVKKNKFFSIEYERTFWPDIDNTDGFYVCRIRRTTQM